MALPFGQILVAAVGAAVIGVGISQIVKGIRQKFVEDLDRNVSQGVRRLGTVGYICKGTALVIVGALFGWAAFTYDPEKAGGMDAALATIKEQPAGTVLLVAMAAGIACFGAYCFAWARFARLPFSVAGQPISRLCSARRLRIQPTLFAPSAEGASRLSGAVQAPAGPPEQGCRAGRHRVTIRSGIEKRRPLSRN